MHATAADAPGRSYTPGSATRRQASCRTRAGTRRASPTRCPPSSTPSVASTSSSRTRPPWVTGQTHYHGAHDAATSVLDRMAGRRWRSRCGVRELHVSIFVASASFLKRALKTTWQASWLQRQRLNEHLRVVAAAASLSPVMHKLGMATSRPTASTPTGRRARLDRSHAPLATPTSLATATPRCTRCRG